MKDISERLRSAGDRVAFTNGCFDLLHSEHVRLLKQAKALGDILVVGLNSDSSVKRIKGGPRPINSEADRAYVLSGIEFVDHVVLFDEDTPCDLLWELRPDLLVKGSDYAAEDVVGRDIVLEYGGEVRTIDTNRGVSTTGTIERILDRYWRADANQGSREAS